MGAAVSNLFSLRLSFRRSLFRMGATDSGRSDGDWRAGRYITEGYGSFGKEDLLPQKAKCIVGP